MNLLTALEVASFHHSSSRLFILSITILVSLTSSINCLQDGNSIKDKFYENLYIRPLADGKLFAHFQFTTLYRKDIKSLRWENEIEILPLSMVDLVATTDLHKLHFSLTKGNWNYRNSGYPVRSSPPGAQIRAQFSRHNEDNDRSWRRLVNSLAGKFCASLASADEKTLVPTKLAFGHHSISPNSTEHTLYSNLPEETLCTENLTPWKKLLPCYSNSGLASLLNAVNLLRSSYSSLSLDLEPVNCITRNGDPIDGCEQVRLTQSLSLVFNPLLQFEGKQIWSISKLFGNSIRSQCPLASQSQVHVDITDLEDEKKLYPSSYEKHSLKLDSINDERLYATYDIQSLINNTNGTFNLGIKQNQLFKKTPLSSRPPIPIYLRTHVAGLGAFEGSMKATIGNSLNESVRVTYMHALPHFLRIYLHTLTIKTNLNHELKPDKLNFILSKDESPTLIEFSLVLPANSETQIAYEFERAFLRWTDFKPDANKGILIGPAVISITNNSILKYLVMPLCETFGRLRVISTDESQMNRLNITKLELIPGEDSIRIYARPLLVILPTPDFSMPYNVLCLVSTALVAAFGPIHGITTRKPIIKIEKRQSQSKDSNEVPEQVETEDRETKKDK